MDIARGELNDLVVYAEFAGHAARVRHVIAAGSPDRERHAFGVQFTYVQERQGAVEAARENHADRQIGVDPNSDAVFQRRPHQPGGLADIGDWLVAVPHGQQVDICGNGWVPDGASPSVVAGRNFADWPAHRDKRLKLRRHVQVTAAAGPVERFNAERVASQVNAVHAPVNDGERKLATQAVYRLVPPLKERLQNNFGVAVTS